MVNKEKTTQGLIIIDFKEIVQFEEGDVPIDVDGTLNIISRNIANELHMFVEKVSFSSLDFTTFEVIQKDEKNVKPESYKPFLKLVKSEKDEKKD